MHTKISVQPTGMAGSRISARPRLSRMPAISRDWTHGSALDYRHKLWLTSGRAAIAHALMHAKLPAGSEILIPAYACESMLEPIRHLGHRAVFYPLGDYLRVDSASLVERVSTATKAMLLTRFFGFDYPSEAIYDFCQSNGIKIIEDRAHCFFGHAPQAADYVIYSAPKFFPVFEGGMLASDTHDISDIDVTLPPIQFQLRAALWPSDYAAQFDSSYQKAGHVRAAGLVKQLFKRKAIVKPPVQRSPAAADGGSTLEEFWLRKRMSFYSRFAVTHSDLASIAHRRRENWRRLVSSLQDVDSVRLTHYQLSEDTVPYALGILVQNPDSVQQQLIQQGVPVYRWEKVSISSNDESLQETMSLSHRLLQIPVHQAQTLSEIDFMAKMIKAAASKRTDV